MWIGWQEGWFTDDDTPGPRNDDEAREWTRSQMQRRPDVLLYVTERDAAWPAALFMQNYRPDLAYVLARGRWPEIWETFMAHVKMRR